MIRTFFLLAVLLTGTAFAQSAVTKADRARWQREHRAQQRTANNQLHQEQQAMKRWDREHGRRPLSGVRSETPPVKPRAPKRAPMAAKPEWPPAA